MIRDPEKQKPKSQPLKISTFGTVIKQNTKNSTKTQEKTENPTSQRFENIDFEMTLFRSPHVKLKQK